MINKLFSFLKSKKLYSVEKWVAIRILHYIPGVAAGCAFEILAAKLGMKPSAGWVFLSLLSVYMFAYSKMSGLVAALATSWAITGLLMISSLPLAMVLGSGVALLCIADKIFYKPDILAEALPPTMAKPVSKNDFFTLAQDGMGHGNILMGEDIVTGKPVWIPQDALVEHMQTVGITRCGKTHFQNSIAYQGSIRKWTIIYITGKPSAIDWDMFLYLANRAGRGKEVLYFDPLDEKHSDSLNPIAPVGSYATELEVAHQIMRAIGREPPAAQERTDAFYKSADFSRILDLAGILLGLERSFTLRDCYLFFSNRTVRDYTFREAEKKGLENEVERMREMFNSIGGKKYDAFEAITSQLRPWISEPVSSKVNDPNPIINIPDLMQKGGLLYCALSPARLHAQANALGRQIIAQIFAASEMLGSRHIAKPPVILILDEFQEYLAPFFNSMISQAGGRQVCIVLAHQDFMQLQRVEGIDKRAFSANIINNTATKIFFSTRSSEDGETMSKLLGTKNVIKRSRTVSWEAVGEGAFGSVSEREGEEFKVHPNWFKTPKRFLAACSSKTGSNIIKTVLFDIKGIHARPLEKRTRMPAVKPALDLMSVSGIAKNGESENDRREMKKKAKEIYEKLSGGGLENS